ncbi:MAG: hypothetical protein J6X56_04740 [Ruminococcus sp.]|nr:hypothetical protein [Ruminococcus sp.]
MLRTANYDLCQYEGSDKTSYLINYNGDMLKIDTGIKGAKDAADNAQSKANTADGKADANAASISTLDTQINGAGGVAADVSSLQGSVNTINSLIGTGEPTTQDKTIIGAINELAGEIPQGGTSASDVSYDNTSSGLTADDVQEAIDEIVQAIPSAAAVETQRGTLAIGSTSVVLTFAAQEIGANTLIDIYTDSYGVSPSAVATTSTTVTLTFEAQASAVNVAVVVRN